MPYLAILLLLCLPVVGCGVNQSTSHRIDCKYSGLDQISLGINGYAVEHYDVAPDSEIQNTVYDWLDTHRDGWQQCRITVPANVFISGDLFQVNINDRHIAVLWSLDMNEKSRWVYRARDESVDKLLESIKLWRLRSLAEHRHKPPLQLASDARDGE